MRDHSSGTVEVPRVQWLSVPGPATGRVGDVAIQSAATGRIRGEGAVATITTVRSTWVHAVSREFADKVSVYPTHWT
ncbi:hypothetical protein GCM10017559_23890 [Streptosporangium longisporum]|uniref:Uncharacterized protein n=1 Tax=Streptosporangium longisporum TaxID=46187 RepID=A0ABN3XWI8_9ACTN